MKKKLPSSDAYGRLAGEREGKMRPPFRGFRNIESGYERFFAGYTGKYVIDDNGRKRFVRVYTGSLFYQKLSVRQAVCIRLLYVFLFLLSFALFLTAIALNTDSNKCWYSMLCAAAPVIFFFRFFFAVAVYSLSGVEMKEREYRDGALILRKTPFFLFYMLALAIAGTAVMFATATANFSATELLRLILLILSGGAITPIGLCESKIRYEEEKNEQH